MLTPVFLLWTFITDHMRRLREDEHGYTTETVIVTAALAALAIIIVVIVAEAVTAKANSIHL